MVFNGESLDFKNNKMDELEKAKELVEASKIKRLEEVSRKLQEFLKQENISLRVVNNLNVNILESRIAVDILQ